MNPSSYNFIPLSKTDAHGAPYTIGHAIIWDPRRVRRERWVLKPGQTERGLTCIIELVMAN